jgi:hypothetical protein
MATNDKILSIDSDDDNNDYDAFNKYLEEDTNRKKNKTILEIESMGDMYLKEIELKNAQKDIRKQKLIKYILKHSKLTYSGNVLNSYSFEDIQEIYNELKSQNKSFLTKIFHFIFNVD